MINKLPEEFSFFYSSFLGYSFQMCFSNDLWGMVVIFHSKNFFFEGRCSFKDCFFFLFQEIFFKEVLFFFSFSYSFSMGLGKFECSDSTEGKKRLMKCHPLILRVVPVAHLVQVFAEGGYERSQDRFDRCVMGSLNGQQRASSHKACQ